MLDTGSSKSLVKKSWVISYCTESLLFIISIILLGHDHLSAAPEGTIVSPWTHLPLNSATYLSTAAMLSVLAKNAGVILVRNDDEKFRWDSL